MARPRKIANMFKATASNTQFTTPEKSKGILDDFPIRQMTQVAEPPTQNTDATNKKYVDDEIAAIPPSVNYWDRTGTVLSPDTAGDDIATGADDNKVFFGAANDAGIDYDGDDLTLYPNIVWNDAKVYVAGLWNNQGDIATHNGKGFFNVPFSEECLAVSRAGVQFLSVVPYEGDGCHWSARKDSWASANNTIFTEFANSEKNHDHPTNDDPHVYIHSNTNPDTDNTQWLGFHHDRTDAVMEVGTGGVNVSGAALFFTGVDSGLCYGGIHMHGVHETITLTQNVYTSISSGAAMWSDSPLNDVTTDLASGALIIGKAGVYKVDWSLSAEAETSSMDCDVDLFIDGVEQADGASRRVFGAANDKGNMGATALLDCAAGATIDLRVKNTANDNDMTVYDVNINAMQVGGT